MPDAFVVTDLDRRILTANSAFLDSAQLGSEEQARGEQIDRWLGRAGVDVSVLFNSLAENGSVRQFQTVMRGQFGTMEDVEVSGVAAVDSNSALLWLQHPAGESPPGRDRPQQAQPAALGR